MLGHLVFFLAPGLQTKYLHLPGQTQWAPTQSARPSHIRATGNIPDLTLRKQTSDTHRRMQVSYTELMNHLSARNHGIHILDIIWGQNGVDFLFILPWCKRNIACLNPVLSAKEAQLAAC